MGSYRNRLLWILLALAAVLLIVAVVAGVAYVLLRQQGTTQMAWRDPIVEIVPEQIMPELALYPLAGASESETIDAAIVNGDLETAYSTLVFSRDLTDAQRAGRLLQLGKRFGDVGAGERAWVSYQLVYDTAILSPMLTDHARAESLLAAGMGWAGLKQTDDALDAYDQVLAIALSSPFLQPAQRWELLTTLKVAFEDVGAHEQRKAVEESISGFDEDLARGDGSAVSDVSGLPLMSGEAVSTPEVGLLEETRRQAAYALLLEAAGTEPPPGLVGDLAQALIAEDAAKVNLYRQVLEGTTQPGKRIDVHWQMIEWLLLKYKVAVGGVGLSAVPEWEEQAAEIQSELTRAYEELYFDYEDLVTALPDASLLGSGSYSARRSVILAGRLGQYPNYPAQQMRAKLLEAVGALISGGYTDGLYVNAGEADDDLQFSLSPASEFGVGNPPTGPQ